jgi:predicted small secreted protein
MKRLTIALLSLLALHTLAACQTWHGFGKDLTSAGKAITGEDERDNSGY